MALLSGWLIPCAYLQGLPKLKIRIKKPPRLALGLDGSNEKGFFH
jgi:hypothetical protein